MTENDFLLQDRIAKIKSINEQENVIGEVWKKCVDYEDLYLISNKGRIKSVPRTIEFIKYGKKYSRKVYERILKLNKQFNGYLSVTVSSSNFPKGKKELVHRLVAKTFIPNPSNLPCINHKDECKSNNSVENLEWCDKSYNALYGTCQERVKKHKIKPVYMLDKSTEKIIKKFTSISDAAKETGAQIANISAVARGRAKTACGYKWKYANKEE